jgi:hypothetical protein
VLSFGVVVGDGVVVVVSAVMLKRTDFRLAFGCTGMTDDDDANASIMVGNK